MCWESRSLAQWRRAEEDKERQKHAAIAYDQPGAKVTELPASMVYGTRRPLSEFGVTDDVDLVSAKTTLSTVATRGTRATW